MKAILKKHGTWIALIILALIIGALTQGAFFSPRNITNLVRQVSINGILAVGMTMIILTSGIDLSIGSLVALSGIFVGLSQLNWGWAQAGLIGAVGSLVLGSLVGTVVGGATGAMVSGLGIPPFVITLGMMVIARGIGLILSQGSTISPMGDTLIENGQGYLSTPLTIAVLVALFAFSILGNRRKLQDAVLPLFGLSFLTYAFISYRGFPTLALYLAAVVGIFSVLLTRTPFGRGVYAIGSNETASVWAGVSIRKIKWMVYGLNGMLAGLCGALVTARQNGASPGAGELAELDAIAAVVIGGTSLKGGTGTVVGSILGAFIIGILNNGMDLLEITSFYQMVFKGLIIIVAVSLDRTQRST